MKVGVQGLPWRPALLRGVEAGPDGLRALVALSAEQLLRVPVAGECAVWEGLVGRRVWVDPARHRAFADVPVARLTRAR
jgi:hypothetical protein